MAQSKYDSNQDGVCDADVCKNVLIVNRNYDPWTSTRRSLRKPREDRHPAEDPRARRLDGVHDDPDDEQPDADRDQRRMGQGLREPVRVRLLPVQHRRDRRAPARSTTPTSGSPRTSRPSAATRSAAANAATDNGANPLPSVDADMDACVADAGRRRVQRVLGGARQRLMEEIVPWVPYRWGAQNVEIADSVVAVGLRPVGGCDRVLEGRGRQRAHDGPGGTDSSTSTWRGGPRRAPPAPYR